MLITALYALLILSTLAVVGAAIAAYVRVRKHMKQPHDTHPRPGHDEPPSANTRR
ncbi:MAG TPA: hypothetical protein VEG32_06125 [Clostridia bacterium]|nr:hypothetical protein [Clostridia bacterium]